jgi:putative thiamine transport system permease protein
VILPAFGWWPVLGRETLTLAAFAEVLAWPGFWRAAGLSLWTGLAATALSVVLTVLIVAGWQGTRSFAAVTRVLAPLLAVPHAAAAFGLAFLIAPSGWVARAVSPGLTGWEVPPDLLIVNDPLGLTLIAGLVVKEVPFLLLMTLAALAQVDGARSLVAVQSLGAGRVAGWCLAVLPQVWPALRLPVLAVLAFSVGVVDVALILGPTRPAPLAVVVVDWANDPDLALRFRAAAGAVVLLALAAVAVAVALTA